MGIKYGAFYSEDAVPAAFFEIAKLNLHNI
jgi:hypothetical protein